MALKLGNTIKLTADVEKAFVALGEIDPGRSLTEDELRAALPKAIDTVGGHRPDILRKVFQQYVEAGRLPPIR